MKYFNKILGIISAVGSIGFMIFLVYIVSDMAEGEFKRGYPAILLTFVWLCSVLCFSIKVLADKIFDPELRLIDKEIALLKKKIEKKELLEKYDDLNKK